MTDEQALRLKPCPFCGGSAHMILSDKSDAPILIQCEKCFCGTSGVYAYVQNPRKVPAVYAINKLIEIWNARYD